MGNLPKRGVRSNSNNFFRDFAVYILLVDGFLICFSVSATTNLKFVFSHICYFSFFTNFVLSDLYRILITNSPEIHSEILRRHILTKLAKCTYSDGHSNHNDIICERLFIVTGDKWYWDVDDIFLRTQFTFNILE